MILTFGKHKGNHIKDIPDSYLEWGAKNLESPKWRKAFENEMKRRMKENKEIGNKLKTSLKQGDLDSALKFLTSQAESEIEKEITNSGCAWEYQSADIDKLAADKASQRLEKLRAEIAIENLDREFMEKLGVDICVLNKIQNAHLSEEGGLSRSRFGSEEKYLLAREYAQKRTDIIYQAGLALYV